MDPIGRIREALKGIDLLGAEAIELRPDAVLLVVLRPSEAMGLREIDDVRRAFGALSEMLQAEGVRAVACIVPPGFALDVIEVPPTTREEAAS